MANIVYRGSDVAIKHKFGDYHYSDFVYIMMRFITDGKEEILTSWSQDNEVVNMKIINGELYSLLNAPETAKLTPGVLRCVVKYGMVDELFSDNIKDIVEEIPTNIIIKEVK